MLNSDKLLEFKDLIHNFNKLKTPLEHKLFTDSNYALFHKLERFLNILTCIEFIDWQAINYNVEKLQCNKHSQIISDLTDCKCNRDKVTLFKQLIQDFNDLTSTENYKLFKINNYGIFSELANFLDALNHIKLIKWNSLDSRVGG